MTEDREASDTDPKPLIRDVYATLAWLHRAQDVEHGIVNLLIWTGVGDGSYRAFDELEAANVRLFNQTMGAIKNRLMERLPLAEELEIEESLIRAVRLRNFLAHEYFRQRTVALLFRDGQKQMVRGAEVRCRLFRRSWLPNRRVDEHFLRCPYADGEESTNVTERAWKRGFGRRLASGSLTDTLVTP